MKRNWIKRSTKPLRRTKLRLVGHSETSDIKKDIQALLRKIVMMRDGGCILRHYHEAGHCSGYKNDGSLVLQAEHLVTRSNSATFGDTRNIVCLCRGHHGFFKAQYGKIYWEIIRKHIGKKLWMWIKSVEEDRTPHKMDWKLVKLSLEQELKHYYAE